MAEDPVVAAIYNFRRHDALLASGGQPLEEEFVALARAGFEVVINLALLDADYSVPDEPERVRALGMEFCHIPVIWERPQLEDLARFFAAMERQAGRRIFVHCAANMRAAVFLALYHILRLGWPTAVALAEVHTIWAPDPVWTAFINKALQARPGS